MEVKCVHHIIQGKESILEALSQLEWGIALMHILE
jgi:hypothetical protein